MGCDIGSRFCVTYGRLALVAEGSSFYELFTLQTKVSRNRTYLIVQNINIF
jgi:hypothetical protein